MLRDFGQGIDLVAEPDEEFTIEVQPRVSGLTLYIHSSKGDTPVRICRIKKLSVDGNFLLWYDICTSSFHKKVLVEK